MPNVSVRLFAGLHQLIGERELEMRLPEGATIAQLRDRLGQEYPVVEALLPTLVCAIDEEYVESSQLLREGDCVALIPPVSGGSGTSSPMFVITREPLDAAPLVEAVRRDESGAVALFYGVVRNENMGHSVRYLEYDVYPEMAIKKMREVAEEVESRYSITGIGVLHRVGRLEIGETSLLVAVSSAHREAAFEACHFAVDRIKQVVPIWKKEVWDDGEEWTEGHVPGSERAEAGS